MARSPAPSLIPIPICAADVLVDGGIGVRFPVLVGGRPAEGFVVRHMGSVHGYLNRCVHAGIELDWPRGRFFDAAGRYLMCATHGAVYRPDDGRCAGGPCAGQSLRSIAIVEQEGHIFWKPDHEVVAVPPPPA